MLRATILIGLALVILLVSACSGGATSVPIDIEPTLPVIEIQALTTNTPTPVPPTATPLPTSTPEPTSTSTPEPDNMGQIGSDEDTVYLHLQPGDAGEVARILYAYAPIQILRITENNEWVEVAISDGTVGWVRTESVETELDMDALEIADIQIVEIVEDAPDIPVEEVVVTPGGGYIEAEGIVNVAGLRMRELPSKSGKIIRFLRIDSTVLVLERTDDNSWLKVIYEQDQTGWVAAQYITIAEDLNRVIVTSEGIRFPICNQWCCCCSRRVE